MWTGAVAQIAQSVNCCFDCRLHGSCCLWGCIATDQSGYRFWPLSIGQSTSSKHVVKHQKDYKGMEEGLPYLVNRVFSFTSNTQPSFVARIHYGENASHRLECDVLAMVCLEILDPTINGNVALAFTTYLCNVTDHLRPFKSKIYSVICGLFHQDNVPGFKAEIAQEWLKKLPWVWGVEGLTFPSSWANWACVGWVLQIVPVHENPTLQLKVLKGSAVSQLQGFSWVHPSTIQSCFGSHHTTIRQVVLMLNMFSVYLEFLKMLRSYSYLPFNAMTNRAYFNSL